MNTEKYTSVTSSRILTNDLYLAAYLLNQGCEISAFSNNRNRVSFSAEKDNEIFAMRDCFRSGNALVDISSFRDSLKTVRKMMNTHQANTHSNVRTKHRSDPCPKSPKQLSRV